jgi:glycosyltransferase involved in cell wall biosynthesis
MPELFQDQVDGLAHEPENPVDLAAAIVSLLKDPARAAQLGHQAGMSCEHRFHPDVIASRTADFYRKVIERTKPRRIVHP